MIAEIALATLFLQTDPSKVSTSLTAAYELLTPAGQTAAFNGRPVDLCLSADGKTIFVKDNTGLRVFESSSLKEIGSAPSKDGTSLIGLALSEDGSTAYLSNSASQMWGFKVAEAGTWKSATTIELKGKKGASYPCGITLEGPGKALVCLSRNNSLAEVDLATGKMIREMPTGVAPFQVLVQNGKAFVSCQGGRFPKEGELTADSSGTVMPVDKRGIALTGVISVIDLSSGSSLTEIKVGLQPGALLSLNSHQIVVANANADSISVIDSDRLKVTKTLVVKPDLKLPFGSMPNALAATPDGKTLFVALAGNNAIAQIDVSKWKVQGFIPTAWFPGALAVRDGQLYIANTKGFGAYAERRKKEAGHNSHDHLGCIERVALPSPSELAAYTATVIKNERVPEILQAYEMGGKKDMAAVPVPLKPGQPSVFKHIVFVLKENRTYDQILGDMKEGDGDPKLCVFGEKVTPNAHAMARQYVLLDNYFCNGVLSADGHTWAMEGIVTPYLERAFGGFTRSYDYGSDAITLAASGQVWNPILGAGLSFVNFGCEDSAGTPKDWQVSNVWRAFEKGRDTHFTQDIGIARLKEYSNPNFPGWNMAIPDVLRMDRFMAEFKKWETSGLMPNLVFVYLPQDHTAGTSPQYPTPASYVADNDLAMGRLVDALSHSKFWKDSLLIANEDDPQAGFDHVDGHRSVCYVVSPYTKRRQTVSTFYNQTSVLHTILQIFGLPPLNQKVAASPLMSACFTDKPDFTPFEAVDPQVDMTLTNPAISSLKGNAKKWALASQKMSFESADFRTEEEDGLMNRILWYAMKGEAPYPAKFSGPHGRGLKKKGLQRDPSVVTESDR